MDKNVSGVDLDELMKARQELNQERGVETDPNLYSDYNPNRSTEESDVKLENSSEQTTDNLSEDETSNENVNEQGLENSSEDVSSVENEGSDDDLQLNEDDKFNELNLVDELENEKTDENDSKDSVVGDAGQNNYDAFSSFEIQADDIEKTIENNVIESNEKDTFEDTEVEQNEEKTAESSEDKSLNDISLDDVLGEMSEITENEQPKDNVEDIPAVENEQIEDKVEVNPVVDNIQKEEINETENQELTDAVEDLLDSMIDNNSDKTEENLETNTSENVVSLDSENTESKSEDVFDNIGEVSQKVAVDLYDETEQKIDDFDPLEDSQKYVPSVKPEETLNQNVASENISLQNSVTSQLSDENTEIITDFSQLKDILQQELDSIGNEEVKPTLNERLAEVKGDQNSSELKNTDETEEVEEDDDFEEIEEEVFNFNPINDFSFVEEISGENFKNSDRLSYLIGRDEIGNSVYGNFKEHYNLALFGKNEIYTNSFINTMLLSLSLKNDVNESNFVILDADINSSFDDYNNSSYMFFNRVAKTNKEILDTLLEVLKEIDKRYTTIAELGLKNIDQYNDIVSRDGVLPALPYVFVIFNNYTKSNQATDNDKINTCLHQLLKYGRVAGFYTLVVAKDVIDDDDINYNLPSRIAFKSDEDSIYTLGSSGVKSLIDDNDVLFSNIAGNEVQHLKIASLSETEKKLLINELEG